MEVVARYNFTYRDLYQDEEDQSLQDYKNEEERFQDYKAFKAANAELIENTDYYIIETSYNRRLFGWHKYKGRHKRYPSIIAVEARNDGGFYDNAPTDIQFYYASNEEGQYLLDNLSDRIEFTDESKIHLGGWFGFKAKKNFEIPDCVNILDDIGFCGFLTLYSGMEVIWFKLPNGKIAAYCQLDTESG